MSKRLSKNDNSVRKCLGRASEQQPMKFYCEKVGGVSGEIGTRPFIGCQSDRIKLPREWTA
ncbi:hypothetical protein T09_1384 [Trichinella sp. T9]|nr:hypothetical protein T09_1384 [Trichinella sp. T9]